MDLATHCRFDLETLAGSLWPRVCVPLAASLGVELAETRGPCPFQGRYPAVGAAYRGALDNNAENLRPSSFLRRTFRSLIEKPRVYHAKSRPARNSPP